MVVDQNFYYVWQENQQKVAQGFFFWFFFSLLHKTADVIWILIGVIVQSC